MEKINWDDILTKFKNRKCSIAEFCKENNIKQYSLYHRRKRAGLLEKTKSLILKPSKKHIKFPTGFILSFWNF